MNDVGHGRWNWHWFDGHSSPRFQWSVKLPLLNLVNQTLKAGTMEIFQIIDEMQALRSTLRAAEWRFWKMQPRPTVRKEEDKSYREFC